MGITADSVVPSYMNIDNPNSTIEYNKSILYNLGYIYR